MRKPIDSDVLGRRVAKHFRRTKDPLLAMIQSLQDLTPPGSSIDPTIELQHENDELLISYQLKPMTIRIVESDRIISITVQPRRAAKDKRTSSDQ